ncbi:hypothetical protein ACQJBY_027956 [Aegilops geniculata]
MCFIGYSAQHKGVKCLEVSIERVYISRDVVFDETQFPFEKLHPNVGALLRKEILLLPSHLSGISCEGSNNYNDPTLTNTSTAALEFYVSETNLAKNGARNNVAEGTEEDTCDQGRSPLGSAPLTAPNPTVSPSVSTSKLMGSGSPSSTPPRQSRFATPRLSIELATLGAVCQSGAGDRPTKRYAPVPRVYSRRAPMATSAGLDADSALDILRAPRPPGSSVATLKEICPRGNNKVVICISLYHDKCLFMLELY